MGNRSLVGWGVAVLLALVSLLGASPAGAVVSGKVKASSFEGDLSDLPASISTGPSDQVVPEGRIPGTRDRTGSGAEVGQGSARTPGDAGEASVSSPIVNFAGTRDTGSTPPDPTGEVGPNHFVEAVNVQFEIFNRSGTSLAGPVDINVLWTGAGGLCEANNDGDPIVMYDQVSDRWIIAQLAAVPDPYAMCIAISKTGDPVGGGWWLYEAPMSAFPDYEKFGIWRDVLYMTTFEGADLGAFAFEYSQMKQGLTATFVKRTTPSLDQTRGTRILPADTDGEQPAAAGAPNVMLQTVDANLTSAPSDVDRIEIFEFQEDFNTTANSTFTKVAELPTAPFDNSMCYTTAPSPFRDCIPQSGSSDGLDPLTNRPLWRASHRMFDDHQSIVFNQTVDENGADHAGIRWYELRKPLNGGSWSIFQQGTFSPDSTHRWMGSAAINRLSEIGLGYSASSSSIFPGLRYAGRVAGDPLGQLGPEQTLVNGAEPESTGSHRWGDYSHMSIDPLDDCTMWYVGEFGDRRTQIGSFQVSDCIPDTSISGPSGAIADSTPSFTLSADEPDVSFQCSIDGGAFAGCPASYTTPELADGEHTLSVRAVGAKGAVDPSPATQTFTIDTTVVRAALKAKKTQKQRGKNVIVKTTVSSGEVTKVVVSGKVKIGRKSVGLKKVKKTLPVGSKIKAKLKASKKAARKIRKAIKRGKKPKANLTAKFTDSVGNKTTKKKKVKLK